MGGERPRITSPDVDRELNAPVSAAVIIWGSGGGYSNPTDTGRAASVLIDVRRYLCHSLNCPVPPFPPSIYRETSGSASVLTAYVIKLLYTGSSSKQVMLALDSIKFAIAPASMINATGITNFLEVF